MVNVAQVVRNLVEQRPFLQEALSKGIVNHAALAESLMPDIEKYLNKKVKFSAVNMAIRRLAVSLENSFKSHKPFEKDTDVVIRSDLVAITFFKPDNVQVVLKKLYHLVEFRRGDFLTVTHGLNEMLIQTNEKYEKQIISLIPKGDIRKIIRNLSSLTINIPVHAVDTVGVMYTVTRAMAWANINIIDIVSTFREMTLVVKEKDTARSFEVLKEVIRVNS